MQDSIIPALIPTLVTTGQNDKLTRCPSIDEVFEVIKSMDHNSSPGPNGFHGKFYIECWSIIKHDLYNAVCTFFLGAELPKS
jgi:hypothetical protein